MPADARKSAKIGRPDDRRREIESILRERVVTRVWLPASRIPTRLELCAEFTAGPTTIQRILADMEADGFIHSEGSRGTYVASRPPNETNVAVVLPPIQRRSRYFDCVADLAQAPRDDGLRLTVYRDIDTHLGTPDAQALRDAIQRRCLLGILFPSPPHGLHDTPLLTAPHLGRCAFMAPDPQYPSLSTVHFAGTRFMARSLDYLTARGRSRLAVVSYHDLAASQVRAIGDAGMTLRPWWALTADIHYTEPCRSLARLLFHPGQQERPDALIIADDNLVEALALGIQDMGLRVPDDLDIVALCNFPSLPAAALPITYLGYDMREALELGLQALRQAHGGGPPVAHRVDLHVAQDLQPPPRAP